MQTIHKVINNISPANIEFVGEIYLCTVNKKITHQPKHKTPSKQ